MGALVVVDFYDDKIEAVREDDGSIWVSIRRCCENLNLSLPAQMRKLSKRSWAVVAQKATTGPDGKQYTMSMVDIATLPGWLFTIDPRRAPLPIRNKIVRYQRECAKVLADYFLPKPTSNRGLNQPLVPTEDMIEFRNLKATVLQLASEIRAIDAMQEQIVTLRQTQEAMRRNAVEKMKAILMNGTSFPAQPGTMQETTR